MTMRLPCLFYVLLIIGILLPQIFIGQQKKLYLSNEEHTDYMWTADAATYRDVFIKQLDYYINLMETENDTLQPQFQHRYNCDNTLWVYEYEKAKSPANFQRLISQVKSGHISVPYNTLVPLYGAQNAEIALRGMYYGGYLQRKYDIRMSMAVAMENQTFPLGISSLWAGAGAKYSWKGVCNCGSPDLKLTNRKNEIYYSKGRDGKGVLMKWYDFIGTNDLGGYAEGAKPNQLIDKLSAKCNTTKYPYAIAGAFGASGDQLESYFDNFPSMAKAQTNASQAVFVSNEQDFFEDFEKQYANVIPTRSVSFGNDWDLLTASMAKVSGDVKRSVEKLRAAEAMAALVALKDTSFGQNLAAKRELAWISVGKYYDHDWTADGPASDGRAAFQREMQANFSGYADTLYNLAKTALGKQIVRKGTANRFYVFNPLGWQRTDIADFPYSGGQPVKVVDIKTQLEVPSQVITLNSVQHIRILASDIPSVGYKVFEVQTGTPATRPIAASFSSGVFENDFYKLTLSNNGSITSLLYKADNNFNYAAAELNDFGNGTLTTGTFTVQNSGPVSVTINCSSSSPYTHNNQFTLYKSIQRVDINDQLTDDTMDAKVTYQFPVNISSPTVWHEEVGAVLEDKLESNGGHYADENARYDWQTANHFVYAGNGTRGLTISNLGADFFKLGNSTSATLDENSSNIRFLAAGKVAFGTLGISNQDGNRSFQNQFALQPATGAFSQSNSFKMSLEHQNPLVTGTVGGGNSYPDSAFSLLEITQPDVFLWSLKPSEEGAASGLVVRVWNQSVSGKVTLGGVLPVLSAKNISHVETDISAAVVTNGDLQESIGGQEMKSYRLFFKDSILVSSSYTFNGTGNWTDAANWSNGTKPPQILANGDAIIIDPVAGGECILNTTQTIPAGVSLQVTAGKKFRIAGNLTIAK